MEGSLTANFTNIHKIHLELLLQHVSFDNKQDRHTGEKHNLLPLAEVIIIANINPWNSVNRHYKLFQPERVLLLNKWGIKRVSLLQIKHACFAHILGVVKAG